MAVLITMANTKVFRVLEDNESSAIILYVAAFEKMNIGGEKLRLIHNLLIGFGGEV